MKKILFVLTICAMMLQIGQVTAQRPFQHNFRPGSSPALERSSGWLTWADQSSLEDGITTSMEGINLAVMQRFDRNDLTNYDGYNLTKVSFYLGEDYYWSYGTYTIQVYQGGSFTSGTVMNPGQLVASQIVTSYDYETWNTVTLSNPVTIDANQELWFGVSITNAYGTLISFDLNYATYGKGALIYDEEENQWYDANDYGLSFTVGNWGLKAYAEDPNNPGGGAGETGESGNIDLGTVFLDDIYNQNEITTLTVPYGSNFNPIIAVDNYDYYATDDFYDVLYFDMYMDGTFIGTYNADIAYIASGSGVYWDDFIPLTAADIASNNYYGTHTFCVEARAGSNWTELDPSDNSICITVTFEDQNGGQGGGNTYSINVLNNDGSVYPSGNVSVNEGGNQTFTITVPPCSTLQDVFVDGVSVIGSVVNNTYTFYNVYTNHSFQAIYNTTSYTLTATTDGNGTVTPANASATCGGSQTFTITPNAGYEIAHLTDNTADVTAQVANNTYTLDNINEDHTIYVTFVQTGGGSTGIVNYNNAVRIFPNPTSGQLNIQAANAIEIVEVIDLTGKMVIRTEGAGNQTILNVENLTNGIYFIKMRTEGQVSTYKFIKK